MPDYKPILKGVVCGTGRSGTTMLVNAIGQHSQISPMFEVDLFTGIFKDIYENKKFDAALFLHYCYNWGKDSKLPNNRIWDSTYDDIKPVYGSRHIMFTEQELCYAAMKFLYDEIHMDPSRRIRIFIEELVKCHCESDGKPFCVVKTPSLLHYGGYFMPAYPEILMIHIIRDPRDVYSSVKRFWWGPKSAVEACEWWLNGMLARDIYKKAHSKNYYELKYEDFVFNSKRYLDHIFDRMGFEPESIPFVEGDVQENGVGSLGQYKTVLSKEEIATFKEKCGNKMEELRYEV